MGYIKKPIYLFKDYSETGIHQVPNSRVIQVEGDSTLWLKANNNGLTPTTSVQTAVDNRNLVNVLDSAQIRLIGGVSTLNGIDASYLLGTKLPRDIKNKIVMDDFNLYVMGTEGALATFESELRNLYSIQERAYLALDAFQGVLKAHKIDSIKYENSEPVTITYLNRTAHLDSALTVFYGFIADETIDSGAERLLFGLSITDDYKYKIKCKNLNTGLESYLSDANLRTAFFCSSETGQEFAFNSTEITEALQNLNDASENIWKIEQDIITKQEEINATLGNSGMGAFEITRNESDYDVTFNINLDLIKSVRKGIDRANSPGLYGNVVYIVCSLRNKTDKDVVLNFDNIMNANKISNTPLCYERFSAELIDYDNLDKAKSLITNISGNGYTNNTRAKALEYENQNNTNRTTLLIPSNKIVGDSLGMIGLDQHLKTSTIRKLKAGNRIGLIISFEVFQDKMASQAEAQYKSFVCNVSNTLKVTLIGEYTLDENVNASMDELTEKTLRELRFLNEDTIVDPDTFTENFNAAIFN